RHRPRQRGPPRERRTRRMEGGDPARAHSRPGPSDTCSMNTNTQGVDWTVAREDALRYVATGRVTRTPRFGKPGAQFAVDSSPTGQQAFKWLIANGFARLQCLNIRRNRVALTGAGKTELERIGAWA